MKRNFWIVLCGLVLLGLAIYDPTLAAGGIYNSVPLALLALAFSIPMRTGFYNIGAEGQILIGGLAAAAVGASSNQLPAPAVQLLAISAAAIAAVMTIAVAWLWREKFGVDEVVTTLLMTLIIQAVTSQVVASWGGAATMHTPFVRTDVRFSNWVGWESWRIGAPFLIAVSALFAYATFLRSRGAVVFRASGFNPRAVAFSGHRIVRVRILAVAVGGALAGVASLQEVLFNSGAFFDGFASGAGFAGIGVALLMGPRPVGIALSALIFGFLQEGMVRLQVYGVPSAVGTGLQGAAILAVLAIRARSGRAAKDG